MSRKKSPSKKSDILKEHAKLINKHGGYIVSQEAVFDVIDLVLNHYYKKFNLVDATMEEDGSARFIYLNSALIALADYVHTEEGLPTLSLSFHVACLPNTAIKLYKRISNLMDIVVLTDNTFYPKINEDGDSSTILYNKQALKEYNINLSKSICSEMEKQKAETFSSTSFNKKIFH